MLLGLIGGHIAFRRGRLKAPAGVDPLEVARARKLLRNSTAVISLAGTIALAATLVFVIREGAFELLPITLFAGVLIVVGWGWVLFAWRRMQ